MSAGNVAKFKRPSENNPALYLCDALNALAMGEHVRLPVSGPKDMIEAAQAFNRVSEMVERLNWSFQDPENFMSAEDRIEVQKMKNDLQRANEEIQIRMRLLADRSHEVECKNQEVERARQELAEKDRQLTLSSKYKSEFLANMSHELRTPLNSLLILSNQLTKNSEGNLSARQTDFAKTIHGSGTDLLMLINDILDLSKIESGTVTVEFADLQLNDLQIYVARTFRHVAESKNVNFVLHFNPSLPKSMFTDAKRLQQIIKNLLSNAFKFTHQGVVTLSVEMAYEGWNQNNEDLNSAEGVLAFSVTDTGIGIAAEKQMIIFEAFQQADGSTSRKYGGTGLGLAISRELSRLLGGEIRLVSGLEKGSTFTLYLPVNAKTVRSRKAQEASKENVHSRDIPEFLHQKNLKHGNVHVSYSAHDIRSSAESSGDDRDRLQPGDRILLVAGSNPGFINFIMNAAWENKLKILTASRAADALTLMQEYKPEAVIMEADLPDISGLRVLERVKNDISLRHIPVFMIGPEIMHAQAYGAGAAACLTWPVKSRTDINRLMNAVKGFGRGSKKTILVVDDDPERINFIQNVLGEEKISIHFARDEESVLGVFCQEKIDCLVTGKKIRDIEKYIPPSCLMPGVSILFLHVIVYDSSGGLDLKENQEGLIFFHVARTAEELLDLSALLTHSEIQGLSEKGRETISAFYRPEESLKGKKILVVDDDSRNILALTSVLSDYGMIPFSAENGHDALGHLKENPDMDMVFMDIMMPDMDGMETIRAIRRISGLKNIPIVAVTAKAMKGDREKCIESGAWDYLSKPVDIDEMRHMLEVWLHR